VDRPPQMSSRRRDPEWRGVAGELRAQQRPPRLLIEITGPHSATSPERAR
jgi:hypothetical protein